MQRHETPPEVARVLAKHAPKKIERLLDPATGTGVLFAPLIGRLTSPGATIVCMDTDKAVIRDLRREMNGRVGATVELITADFLKWSAQQFDRLLGCDFDCVIMNPPFAAKKQDWIRLDLPREFPGLHMEQRCVPLEAAFILRAIRLMRPGGRLLAIVPGSIVVSEGSRWLRKCLMQLGAIRYVHELPQFTFPGVESRVYLFVFDKGRKQGSVVLRNHDLDAPESMVLRNCENSSLLRLDHAFNDAHAKYEQFTKQVSLGWVSIEGLAAIMRGRETSPRGPLNSVHTYDFRNEFWHRAQRHDASQALGGEPFVQAGDILVKRVGRRCSHTFGRGIGIRGMPCSDCVLILRPERAADSARLLFAIRTMTGADWFAPLIETGTGARFLCEKNLRRLRVPIGLSERFAASYQSYVAAANSRCFREMCRIERRVRRHLEREVGFDTK